MSLENQQVFDQHGRNLTEVPLLITDIIGLKELRLSNNRITRMEHLHRCTLLQTVNLINFHNHLILE